MTDLRESILGYLKAVERAWRTGDAREHTYRPMLKTLLEQLLPKVTVLNEPAHIDCGAPDFILRDARTGLNLGFVETKDIGDGDLDGKNIHREQFARYKQELDNLVFTDYLDFRFHSPTSTSNFESSGIEAVRIADIVGGRIVPASDETLERFAALLAHFGSATPRR